MLWEVGMKIIAIQGDITQVDVDAIVFPAEEDKGLKRRIEDRLLEHAGTEVEQETVARGPLRVGDTIMTSGGNLRCRYGRGHRNRTGLWLLSLRCNQFWWRSLRFLIFPRLWGCRRHPHPR